jgi:predicted RNase H-like nuclease (RuvC/YqgF family)
MTEQTLVIKHFKNAFVHDVRKVYEELAEQAACWADDALLPLMQYTVEQKEALRQQMESFQSLAQEKKSQREECSTMQKRIDMLKQQLALTHSIAKQLEAHSNA